MISNVTCRNFRALQGVEVPVGSLTAIVGANGSGKTSFLRAINLLLGNAWPSLRSLNIPEDFTDFRTAKPIEISVSFDEPLEREDRRGVHKDVYGLKLVCAEYKRKTKKGDVGDLHLDFLPVGAKGKELFYAPNPLRKGERPDLRPLINASTGIRDQARILFIDHRRSLTQHLPTTRGSILGQLFEPALRALFTRGLRWRSLV
ncbi:MAG: putative ATP-dependent endonuclease of the family [Actinomycetota bacterium]|nr:putative ATP-dependent endonuclease of the family [Actinomycetota bacterium]